MKNWLLFIIFMPFLSFSQKGGYQFAVLKYNGGGDYYANPTSVPNLVKFCNDKLKMNISTDVPYVDVGSKDLFNYPFVHMTGHGNVVFSPQEAQNLRNYLIAGGFLHIDDNYGMDVFIRPELKKIFPNAELIELPCNHEIFTIKYKFHCLPKIHEHDGKPAQAFGIFYQGRLVILYTYQTDLGDGWEDFEVHRDPPEKHKEALEMGANIVSYVFSH